MDSPNAWIGPVLLLAVAAVIGVRKIAAKFGWKPAAIAAVPLVLVIAFIVSVALENRRLAAFASFAEWCTVVPDTTSRPVLDTPNVRGKFVPFYAGSHEASYEVFVRLPATLRAKAPDEMGAVVCIRADVDQVGAYQPSYAPAFVRVWHVTVVHASTRRVVATRTLRGSVPPKSSPKGRTGYGSKPFDQLAELLTSLR